MLIVQALKQVMITIPIWVWILFITANRFWNKIVFPKESFFTTLIYKSTCNPMHDK